MVDRVVVDDGRHAVIGGECQELGFELIAGADVDRLDRVIEAGLFEKQRDLVAVRRGPVVEFNHRDRCPSLWHCRVGLALQRAE